MPYTAKKLRGENLSTSLIVLPIYTGGLWVKSMHRLEVEILKKRSSMFLEEARHALDRGFYDLVCFLSEQSLQLYLKALLLELVGDYPRTHSIRHLLGELNRVLKSRELEDFVVANRARLLALEDAYLMSRYYIREYEKEDAEDMIRLVEEVLSLLKKILGGRQ
ncbi:MAG: HEPN domain-containing protein [Ignisphaera sp.]